MMWLVPGHTEVSSRIKNWIFLSHDLNESAILQRPQRSLSMSEQSKTSQKETQTKLLVFYISLLAEITCQQQLTCTKYIDLQDISYG